MNHVQQGLAMMHLGVLLIIILAGRWKITAGVLLFSLYLIVSGLVRAEDTE